MRRLIAALVAIFVLSAHAWSCECADKLSPEIEEFIFQAWKTATIGKLSQQERAGNYDKLIKRLLSKANEANVPTDSLEQLARKCIQFEETYREMPPGWDRTDKFANLMYFTNLTRIIVPIHLEMIGYCHQFCRKNKEKTYEHFGQ